MDHTIDVGGATEVQQRTDLEVRGAEIVVELPSGVAMQAFGGFDLDDQLLVDHHVESLASDLESVVVYDRGELSGDSMPCGVKLDLKCCGIDPFTKAKAQLPMIRKCGSDDGTGEFRFDEECHAINFGMARTPTVIRSSRPYQLTAAGQHFGEALP